MKDLQAGRRTVLDHPVYDYWMEFTGNPTWSPDGKSIAYYRYQNKEPWFDLRIVSAEGGEPKVVYANKEITLFPKDWSVDGKYLLCEMSKADKSFALGIFSIASKELRQLISLEWNRPGDARFSPDGKYIVYDITKDGNRDLYLLSVDGKEATRLTDSPGDDSSPTWTEDGRHILFSSNRRGSWDLWGVAVENGKQVAQPFLVKSDFGNYSKRVTVTGKLVYNVSNEMSDISYVNLNPSTGEPLGQPQLITKSFYGKHWRANWSPDGKRVAYIRRTEPPLLCITSIADGKEECIQTGMRYFNKLFWSPDGKSIALSPGGKTGKTGIYRFSLESRELTPIYEANDFSGVGWSSDGRELIVNKRVWKNQQEVTINFQQLVAINILTGKERPLTDPYSPDSVMQVEHSVSTDQKLIICIERNAKTKERSLVVASMDGKEKRVLATVHEPEASLSGPSWSPDGGMITYNYVTGSASGWTGGSSELRLVAADGSWRKTVVKTGQAGLAMAPASWSPDGSRLAFTITEKTVHELWVMENFLPKEERAQR